MRVWFRCIIICAIGCTSERIPCILSVYTIMVETPSDFHISFRRCRDRNHKILIIYVMCLCANWTHKDSIIVFIYKYHGIWSFQKSISFGEVCLIWFIFIYLWNILALIRIIWNTIKINIFTEFQMVSNFTTKYALENCTQNAKFYMKRLYVWCIMQLFFFHYLEDSSNFHIHTFFMQIYLWK